MVKAKLWMQFVTVVSLHQSCKKSTLGWQKENGRKGVIIIKSHPIKNNINMTPHFMCGI